MKKHPGLGLDYCGITIIPPRSLKEFKKLLLGQTSNLNQVNLKI